MDIKEILKEYKKLTIDFINSIENDYKIAENFIELRGKCLEKIKSIEIDKEQLKEIYNELELERLEKESIYLLKLEKEKVNKELIDLKKKKDANQVYNSAYKNINFINKIM